MIYKFVDCELDIERFELRRGGAAQPVEPQVFEILRYFVERHERLVTKDELHEAIWRGRIVSEAALSSRIKAARQAVGDNGADQRLIRTVHGRGFRFVAPVDIVAEAEEAGHPVRDGGAAAQPSAGAEPVQDIQYCTTGDGIRLAYAISGTGPPLIKTTSWLNHLEHDWSSPLWRPWLDALCAHGRLVRYDGRGNGLSDWSVDDLSFEAFVHDLETVVDAIGLQRFALLGMSQGAAVAIAYAARHPERVSRLVMCGGYAKGWRSRGTPDEVARREAMTRLIAVGWGQDNPAFRQVFTSLYIPRGTPEQMESFNEMMAAATAPENAARLHEAFGRVDVADLLPLVRTPTLVVHSRHDAVVPFEQGRLLAAAIPGARFLPLESSNHVLLAGEPAWPRFVRELERFLGPSGAAASSARSSDARSGASAPAPAAVLSADFHHDGLLTGDRLATSAEADLLSRRAVLREEIERLGGTIMLQSGGGLSAGFNDAADAVSCAVQIQRSFGRTHPGGAEGGEAPRLAVTAAADDPAAAMAAAGRLQCLAAPGEIVVPRAIEDEVRRRMTLAAGAADDSLVAELGLSVVRIAGAGLPPPGGAAVPQLHCPVPREPSILVLPFSALGAGEEAGDFAEGLRIDIQNALVKISGLLLIAAGTANAFRGDSPERAARATGVRYILHGTVQTAGQGARISLELVDTLAASIGWAEQFDRTLTDSFAVQDEIAGKVIAALDVKLLSGEQARIWHKTLSDPKAVRLFYRGVREFFRMERDAMAAARRCFETVAELRPDSPIGFTWAALCHWMDYVKRWGGSREESKRLARQWASRAVAMPDADGQAQTVMAHMHLIDREFDAALQMGQAAVAVRPGCANANAFHANVLHYCGEQDEAIRHVRRAIRLSPVYPPFFANILAMAYLASGQPEAAMAVAKEVLRINPRDLQARLVLAAAAQLGGHPHLAALLGREVEALDPAFSVGAFCADQPYRDGGAVDSLRKALLAARLPE